MLSPFHTNKEEQNNCHCDDSKRRSKIRTTAAAASSTQQRRRRSTTTTTTTTTTSTALGRALLLLLVLLLVVSPAVQAQQSEPTVAPSLSASPSAGPPVTTPQRIRPLCYTNVTELYDDMAAMAPNSDFTSRQIFTLCPNTVFDLDAAAPPEDMFFSYLTAKSFTTLQCGEQGRVTDNCIVRGGMYGFFWGPFAGSAFYYWFMTGVQVKGLIFEEQRYNSVLVHAKGDVTFTDCIWRNQKSSGTIVSHWDPTVGNAPGPDTLVLRFENCTFEYIAQSKGGQGGTDFEGVVRTFNPYHHLIFDRCIFRHNYFPGTFQSPRGWALKVAGGTLELLNSCFYNNTFIGWSIVEAFSDTAVIQSGNYAELPHYVPLMDDPLYQNVTSSLKDGTTATTTTTTTQAVVSQSAAVSITCGLIARSSAVEPRNLQDITCLEATESTCASTGYTSNATFVPPDSENQTIINGNEGDGSPSRATATTGGRTSSTAWMAVAIAAGFGWSWFLLLW